MVCFKQIKRYTAVDGDKPTGIYTDCVGTFKKIKLWHNNQRKENVR